MRRLLAISILPARQFVAASAVTLLALGAGLTMAAAPNDTLATGFQNPPNEARPRVWWHWMNGNITQDGIAKDLAWMQRVGIGGLQNFDASLATPQVVEKRLPYMTPEWKQAFQFAVKRADELGLEFGIAASPGWSETGGPWVEPQNGMKKLVWSETIVVGGKRYNAALAQPPAVTGPFQSIGKPKSEHEPASIPADFYRDAAVVAFRIEQKPALPHPQSATVNGAPLDSRVLLDNDLETGTPPPAAANGEPGAIEYTYAKPQTIRSVSVFVANLPLNPMAGPLVPRLEASDDGHAWHTVVEFNHTGVPTTASFPPVTARKFRLVFAQGKRGDTSFFAPAPGANLAALASLGALAAAQAAPKLVDFRLSSDARVNAFEQKAGFAIADDYYALDANTGADVKGLAPSAVIDISSHLTADGRLDWTPPAGTWKVLRMGYSLTGKTNAPATAEATGLEVDKYDAAAVENYLNTYFGMYRAVTGDALIGAHGLRAIVTDSSEVGASNWTPKLIEQFQKLRGYDPRPWLPVLTGEIIGSRQQSDGFLYDFRRTLGELSASEHYGTVAKVAHANGLTVYGESVEGNRTIAGLGDDLELRRFADIPMAALWTYGKGPAPYLIGDVRGAASTAHLYGRQRVAAESLTSILTPWAHAPSDLQPMIDAEFVNGVNLPVIHTSVHQPMDNAPGLSLLVFGQFFTRHETWAEMAKPWIDYIARNSFLLQQGRNVADVAYFYGEEAPVAVQMKAGYFADVPKRYAYDFVPADAVLNELAVDGNDLVTKGGARYKVLYLGGNSQRITLSVLRRLAEFVDAGVTIVGEAPQLSPSLKDDPAAFAQLVHRLWSGDKVTRIGKGRVIAGKDVEAALAEIGVATDFAPASDTTTAADMQVQFVHRQLQDGDLYYVANRSGTQQLDACFRVTGKAPAIWHADTGAIEPVSYRIENGETIVPLTMLAHESFFVVFREPTTELARTVAKPTFTQTAEIGGAWDVHFQANRGAPAAAKLAAGSLSEQSDPGIKYFSGVATYTNTFNLQKDIKPKQPLLIDLGAIGDIAEVRVNGKLAGTVWKAPYRLDIGALVRPGSNTLEVRVANLWVNRLIGDQQPDAQKITFTTIKTYTAKAPLRPSGLIGPVTLLKTTL